MKRQLIHYLLVAMTGLAFTACQSELDVPVTKGSLQIELENISPLLTTRSTPSELGIPEASRFQVKLTNAEGTVVYHKDYTAERIPLVTGTYTVEASFGDNPVLGMDAPYYLGTAQVEIMQDAVTEASITCRVANALLSARFGRTEEERARFDKFYSRYGIRVLAAGRSAEITNMSEAMSIYFRAGTSIALEFYGTLSADGREVSMTLNTNETTLPSVFQAADHAIITLTLPDPESATVVDITKVEMEEATMEETIPLSWLPVPQVLPAHHYDADGNLEGTDLTFTNSYPGMTWKAIVSEPKGTTFRTVQGSGELVSSFADNAEGWVYLPAREYTATFYLVNGDKEMKTGTRTFTVGNPDLRVNTSAYTSYSRYLAGDVTGANACDAYTVYAPLVSFNIAPSLWNNTKYTKNLAVSLGATPLERATVTSGQEGMVFSFANQTGLTPQFDAYALSANLTFDKVGANSQSEVFITGLPASWTPPTEGDWSVHGTHDWNGNHNNKPCVRLGQNTTSQPQYILCQRFAVPAGVKIKAPYDVMMHGATVGTTLTLSFGSTNYFQQKSSSGAFNSQDHYYTDTAYFTTGTEVSEAKAHNSYGSGQTCSRIYSLSYYYSE